MTRGNTRDRSWQTEDRGPPGGMPEDRGLVHTVHQLGPKRELMRNGNLVCYDVPIARVGWMLYGPGEVPVKPNPTSPAIYVERTADELFSVDTMRSFYGAAVVNDHPDWGLYPRGVTPDNYRELSGGYAINVRRGTDGDEDVLLADLVITRRDLIDAVRSGKREVSAGYDADYFTVRPGIGRQTNILANHIALVEKGRCGPRCAIGDHATTNQEQIMPRENQAGAPTRRRLDEAALDSMQEFIDGHRTAVTDDSGESHVHVHVHGGAPAVAAATADAAAGGGGADPDKQVIDKRIDALEKGQATLIEQVTNIGKAIDTHFSDARNRRAGTGDEDTGAAAGGDSSVLATSFQDLQSKAEVLVPGFKAPTFDSAAPRAVTIDSMCKVRGKVLELYASTEKGAEVLTTLTGDSAFNIEGMDCKEKALLFNAAAAFQAKANNAAATADSARVPNGTQAHPSQGGERRPSISPAEINARNKKYHATAAAAGK